jgi:hypothetical protein
LKIKIYFLRGRRGKFPCHILGHLLRWPRGD